MFELSSSVIDAIIEALIPSWEPAFNGPQISYMATKCGGGCSGTCKTLCTKTCKTLCTKTCKGHCKGGMKIK